MSIHEFSVTAIIVTYNSIDTISNTLDAIHESYGSCLSKCIIVDNASADGTADFIANTYDWVVLIRNNTNVGFGHGCNIGFQHVKTPFVLFVNPDAVINSNALRRLIDFMKTNEKAGISAPAIIEGESELQAAGMMTSPLSLICSSCGFNVLKNKRRLIIPGGKPFQTSWVCGAIMLIRTKLFLKLRGFDQRFFLYFEETDLCRRAVINGAEIWAVGQAVAKHVGGASAKSSGQMLKSSCIAEHYYRSRYYYLVKHFGLPVAVYTESFVRIIQYIRRIISRLRSN